MANEDTDTATNTDSGDSAKAVESNEPKLTTDSAKLVEKAISPSAKHVSDASSKTGEQRRTDDEDDDDVTPDDKGMVVLPYRKFMARVTRMSKNGLKKIFGTDDLEKITAERLEFERMKKAKVDAEAAAMTENEKFKKEAEDARAELAKERENYEKRTTREATKQFNREVSSTSKELFSDDMHEIALDKLARAIRKGVVSTPKQASKYLSALASEKPSWRREAAVAKEEEEPVKKKVFISNGASGASKPLAPKTSGNQSPSKSPRPGGGMTRDEVEKSTGYRLA